MAVSATFTSVNVCDEGKPPDTQAKLIIMYYFFILYRMVS